MQIRKHLVIIYFVGFLIINWLLNNFIFLKDYNEKRYTLHTITEIHIQARNSYQAKKAIHAGFARIKELELQLNYFDPRSQVTLLNNKAAYQDIPVSPDTLAIIEEAIRGSEASAGAFDITTTPITRLYGFGTETKQIPNQNALALAKNKVGYRAIEVNHEKSTIRFLKKGMQIDLGGILKGYAVDEAVKVMRSHGIKNGLVNSGGNIYAMGTNRGKPWKVGIRAPRGKDLTEESIELSNNACATSGDYEQFFFKDNKRIAHIFDPLTGKPANQKNGVISVTVVADTASWADVLSTACFVLGKEKADKLIPNKKIFYLEKDIKK